MIIAQSAPSCALYRCREGIDNPFNALGLLLRIREPIRGPGRTLVDELVDGGSHSCEEAASTLYVPRISPRVAASQLWMHHVGSK